MDSKEIIKQQRLFYSSGKTRNVDFIIDKLSNLKQKIIENEESINNVLYRDLKKSKFESYISEFGILISELDNYIKNIKKWSKRKKVRSSLLNFPSSDYIYNEPYGAVLIIAPWNYPFQLSISPVIAAIAAGNTVVLKPSELSENTGALIKKILSEVFDEKHLKVVLGGVFEATALLKEKWDYIFFTGSVPVGKIIAKAAAKNLTPVTLELGGKNPCIVDENVDINLTAKKIIWGKFFNAGQTCIAPDYIIVKDNIKDLLVKNLKIEIQKAYGNDAQKSEDYPRIINKNNFRRLESMLKGVEILYGGKTDFDDNFIGPTIVNQPKPETKLMKNEIFGPILPILKYSNLIEIKKIVEMNSKPLAFYVFTKNKNFYNSIIEKYSYGGGVVNDTMIHFGNAKLPFGGVGESGYGAYRGKHGFETFSHKKSIVIKSNLIDIPIRYAPYKGKLKILKKMFKLLS